MSEKALDPGVIASKLMRVRPDRDQRASQVCLEFLLTLVANSYTAPSHENELRSPKVRRFALRSLVLGRNFLEGYDELIPGSSISAEEYGRRLTSGEEVLGSSHLDRAQVALRSLVDPSTETGTEPGQYLLMPFHESMLWYDARRGNRRFTVRKVRMRGTGVTLGRALLDPPPNTHEETRRFAREAIDGIRGVLNLDSSLSTIAQGVEDILPDSFHEPATLEEDERRSWRLGANPDLLELYERICRHTAGVVTQGGASGPDRMWQLRTVLALDLATDMLQRCWSAVDEPQKRRHLLLALPGPNRPSDRVRLRSERSWNDARSCFNWATIRTIENTLRELHDQGGIDWSQAIGARTERRLKPRVIQPYESGIRDFRKLAQLTFENANYHRAIDGFRVLLETIGMSAGGTRYRYMSATPDLLAAWVGALSREMPMTSDEFFRRVRLEWNIIVSPSAAAGTALADDLDGDELTLNLRRFERLLIECGLASGLSDRTVLVGERAARRGT
ncbi:MAG: hypothetical protein KTU85_05715 [Acidimicrobiia bacterium]|nr:hypothetical protein [Acidimicrobiia bacterium]MCY4456771.1 hypothetical protein [Acidimicrobiaceae bacterium]